MMENSQEFAWRTGRSCIYKHFLHLVFVPKYRRSVFSDAMLVRLEEVYRETCEQMRGELLEFSGEDDHVHLMVSIHPRVAVAHFVGKLKGKSSHILRQEFWPEIKNKLWGKHFWSPSYCAVTCGGEPLATVKTYVENQRRPPSKNAVRQSRQETGRKGELSRVRTRWTRSTRP